MKVKTIVDALLNEDGYTDLLLADAYGRNSIDFNLYKSTDGGLILAPLCEIEFDDRGRPILKGVECG